MELLRAQPSATWDQLQANLRHTNHPHMANHIVTHSAGPLSAVLSYVPYDTSRTAGDDAAPE